MAFDVRICFIPALARTRDNTDWEVNDTHRYASGHCDNLMIGGYGKVLRLSHHGGVSTPLVELATPKSKLIV